MSSMQETGPQRRVKITRIRAHKEMGKKLQAEEQEANRGAGAGGEAGSRRQGTGLPRQQACHASSGRGQACHHGCRAAASVSLDRGPQGPTVL
jgi:hypothetical protein